MSEKTAIEFYNEDVRGTYTLADLEQARRQGAEEERGRCIEAVIDATHGGALRSAVDAIRALGPIGETREETERRVRRETKPISVKERLPDKDGYFLVYVPKSFTKNCRYLVAEFYTDNKTFYSESGDYPVDDVTHWLPIPPYPEKDVIAEGKRDAQED